MTDYHDRMAEMFEDVMADVDGADEDEAALYSRVCAAFEVAVNDDGVPPEDALGVIMAAVLEGAEQAGYDREDIVASVLETFDEPEADR